ncbi:argininosuccinate lyase [Sphingomonas oligophenolica]|uniref:Argininosuccinate lyase n=1 Tax=Sphingomonas oligophenolica TaxID=301154 RepID=A0ABU9Y9G7_9SPHN
MSDKAGDTGRIRRSLSRTALRALGAHAAAPSRAWEMGFIAEVDRAHLVMLVESGLLDRTHAARLLATIGQLAESGFAALDGLEAPRGLYLLYESHLIERLGEEIGGALHTARSRNDLNATVLRLQLREPAAELIRALLRLIAILLARARRFADVVMPIYTHGQAALPGSYGHYLAAIAQPLLRSADALLHCLDGDLDLCPLGAGAVGGTSLPIRTEVTARLLGFGGVTSNSIDAVASRDVVVRLLGEATILGTTLSRLATDLQGWMSAEFGFLSLPDSLVGSSSMMPQKRNPYLLEHVQGRSARPLGALVAAVTAIHAKPFTNNIAAGTESAAGVRDALADVTSAVDLACVMVKGAAPRRDVMLSRAEGTFLEATEICNRLVLAGMPFRAAHHLVGEAITEALERDPRARGDAVIAHVAAAMPHADLGGLDPRSIMRASRFGGGPGSIMARGGFARERAALRSHAAGLKRWVDQWRDAARALDREAAAITVPASA